MHNTRSDLVAILSVALGRIPHKDFAPLTDRNYDTREKLRIELAEYLEAELLAHFTFERRGMVFNGRSDPARPQPKGWRGAR